MLYPSGYHVAVTSASRAEASASKDGYFSSHSAYLGSTRSTCVCWSMISETRMWYGSSVFRHGRSRTFRRYHRRRRSLTRRRSPASGMALADGIMGTVKLYTRTGDRGETSLFDGTRVSKSDPLVDAYGEV